MSYSIAKERLGRRIPKRPAIAPLNLLESKATKATKFHLLILVSFIFVGSLFFSYQNNDCHLVIPCVLGQFPFASKFSRSRIFFA
ncbi:hypothetical protein BT96DRAFT_501664 [Gymnopus androsaceus JB14]|uniref:Transmembrane protein n=1 Tax=Gymnopus androsaceus JB14 TaxID=1447944 RepID=A0A6A4GP05_9AGAR|nr:hypothetical protein BT96DRAFT_501664 [Gymnopus androsaceus JB14]